MDFRCANLIIFQFVFIVCGTAAAKLQFNILQPDVEKLKLRNLSETNNTNILDTEGTVSFYLQTNGGEESIGTKIPAASNDKNFHRKTSNKKFKPSKFRVKKSTIFSPIENFSESNQIFSDLPLYKMFSTNRLFTGKSDELLAKPVTNSKQRSHFKVIHTSAQTENEDLPSSFHNVTLKTFLQSKHKSRNEQTPFKLQPLNRAPLTVQIIQSSPSGISKEIPQLTPLQSLSTNKSNRKLQQTKKSMNTIKELQFSNRFFPKVQHSDFDTKPVFQTPLLLKKSFRNSTPLDNNADSDTMNEIVIADINGINFFKNNIKRDTNLTDYDQVEGRNSLQPASSNDVEKTTKERESRKTDLDSHAISVNTLKTFQLLKQEEKDRRNPDYDIVETFHNQIIPNIYEIEKDDPKVSLIPQNPNIFTNTNFGPAIIPFPIVPNVVNIPSTFSNTVNTNLERNGLNFNNFNLQQPLNRNFIPLSNSVFLLNVPQHQQHQFVLPQHFLQNIPSSVRTTAVSDPILITNYNPGHNFQTIKFLNNNNNKNNKDSKQGTNFIPVQNTIPQFPFISTIHSPNIHARPLIHNSRIIPQNADGSFITFRSPNDAFNFRI